MARTLLVATISLLIGLAAGYVLGRWKLDAEWREPVSVLTEADVRAASVQGADPVPPAGTKVIRPMPLQRSRQALKTLTNTDPVVVTVGSMGHSDDGLELHLTIQNKGRCKIREVRGVAYGFTGWNRPAAMNKHGEHFVAFHSDHLDIEPGAYSQEAWTVRHAEFASLVIAQVDQVTCEDGTRWTRP